MLHGQYNKTYIINVDSYRSFWFKMQHISNQLFRYMILKLKYFFVSIEVFVMAEMEAAAITTVWLITFTSDVSPCTVMAVLAVADITSMVMAASDILLVWPVNVHKWWQWWLLLKYCLKATVENPRGSVEKLSPKESVEGAHTAPQHSVGTQGTVLRGQFLPHCPKDFQQLLWLSKSWGSFRAYT